MENKIKRLLIFIIILLALLCAYFAYNYFFVPKQFFYQVPEDTGFIGPTGPPSVEGPTGPPPTR